MRPQEHAQLSAIAAAAAWQWLKQDVWIPFAASILIDADHYLWHAITQGTLSLRAAVRYYRQHNAPELPEQRLLHQPLVLGLLLFLAVRLRSRLLGLILAGLTFHVCLDRFHRYKIRTLKRTLNEQADFTCPRCDTRASNCLRVPPGMQTPPSGSRNISRGKSNLFFLLSVSIRHVRSRASRTRA